MRRIESRTSLKRFIEELEMLAQLTGKTHVKNLEPEDLRAITLDAATITGVKLAGRELYFGKPLLT